MSTEDNDETGESFESDELPIADLSVFSRMSEEKKQAVIDQLTKAAPAGNFVVINTVDHIQEVAALFGITRAAAKDALIRARDELRDIDGPMDFQTALRAGRPFRRRSWIQSKDPDMREVLLRMWWAFPCIIRPSTEPIPQHATWINIGTGMRMMFSPDDYLATDWEVMP